MTESKVADNQNTTDGTSHLPMDARAVELMASLEVGMMTNRQYLDALKQRPDTTQLTDLLQPPSI